MKNTIVCWCKNPQTFEDLVPLKFIGERNLKIGNSNDFDILFLEGLEKLDVRYKETLQSLGFRLRDVSSLYKEEEKKFSQLDGFTDFGKKCFLRWPVIEKYFAGEGIVHYDGDIVFNEDPKIIAEKVDGLTFVLQGCPAFTVVSNYDWFRQYREELKNFVSNVDNYSQQAWNQRKGWEVTFKTRWSGSYFQKVFVHDQDFISHLLHTGKIIQDNIEDILLRLQDYVVFENPLFVHLYDDNYPYSYKREGGKDYFYCNRKDGIDCHYKKKVLFWHMQTSFNIYASKFLLRQKYLSFLPLGRIDLDFSERKFEDKVNKKIRPYLQHASRLSVYKYLFDESDFTGLLNAKKWWRPGVFE